MRSGCAAVAAALALAVLAACGSSQPGSRVPREEPPPGRSAGLSVPPVTSETDPHYAEALAEARALLAQAVLPLGAKVLSGAASSALSGPAMGTPASSHLVDVTTWWVVPQSMTDTLSFLSAHPPPGLDRSGSSNGSVAFGGIPTGGYAWSAAGAPAYTQAELEIGVAADGPNRSFLRGDGVDLWISSSPAPDTATGARIRVTLATGCPKSVVDVVDVTNVGPGPQSAMLPTGSPTAGLICLYPPHPATSASTIVHLTAVKADRLTSVIDRLSLGSTGGGTSSCPADVGLVDVLVFSYSRQADVDLWYHASGCQTLDNGFVTAAESTTPGFFQPFTEAFTRATTS